MDEALIDPEDLPLERKSLLPGAGFFVPDDLHRARAEAAVAEAAEEADAFVVADPDADGLACVAIIRERHPAAAIVPTSPHDLCQGMVRAAEHADPGTPIYICDLCPDEDDDLDDPLAALADHPVRWYDHHQWPDELHARVESAGVDLRIGASDEVCTADVALQAIGEQIDLPQRFRELAAVTRDHDLWINDDPRSQDLADFAHWTEAAEFVETVRENGADLPESAATMLAERRLEKQALIDRAVDRAEFREIGPWTVATTYGRCSQNEVADQVRENGADAAVIVKPAGSASIRGSEAFERCHEVAAQVNGGGHPRAAGCKPDIYGDMLDYAHHWTSQGAVAKQVILDAFRNLEAAAESG